LSARLARLARAAMLSTLLFAARSGSSRSLASWIYAAEMPPIPSQADDREAPFTLRKVSFRRGYIEAMPPRPLNRFRSPSVSMLWT